MHVLDGVKVVELAIHGFVPACGATLGDWGAEVIKVEDPLGDPLRMVIKSGFAADTGDFNFLWELFNRNKRGIALDLRIPEARAVFDKLIAEADVFITNFLPNAREKLKVTPEDLFKINPRLVYAKGHGQGQRGPDADKGGFDAVSFWARGGLGHTLTPAEGPLIMQRGAMGDAPSGAMLAGGIGAALYQREKTGKGVVVDVALLNTAVWQLAMDLTSTTILRQEPTALNATRALSNPLVGSYRTGDQRWFLLNMLDDTRHFAPTCRALGLDELIDDPRFADTQSRADNREALHEAIVTAIKSSTLADLKQRLEAEDTIYASLSSMMEVIDDPQVIANGYLAPHPNHPTCRVACAPMQFDNEMVEVRRGAPDIGEHTEEILQELGFTPADVANLRTANAIA
ncbi:MAG: CoA transferase [Acidimicrobiia bacterium]|nr:CoA transferase [Acidimicrobiia bacterium]